MSPLIVGGLGFLLVMFLMALGTPIGFSMMTAGFLGILYLSGIDVALSQLASIPYYWTTVYVFMAAPLFIIMGFVFSRSGLAKELYVVAHNWLGRLPGGLGLATIGSCGMFAAVSGTSTAGAATMAAIVYPEMKRYNYDKGLAVGAIAAGGTLGIMIPPSLGFIVYALLTDESIGELFIAGIIPGIIEMSCYFITIIILVKLRPHLAPLSPVKVAWRDKIFSLKAVWPAVFLFLTVLGGIYLGVFTPVEAGAIGAVACVMMTFAMGRMSVHLLVETLLETSRVMASLFMLVMGAMVFSCFLALSQLPQALSTILSGIGSPALLMAVILLMYLPLGAFMDTTAMFVLTVPLYVPTLVANDISLVWFGVLVVRAAEIGVISPPIGMDVFVVQRMVKDISVEKAFKGVIPFLIADVFILAVLGVFPQLSLFLPGLMMKVK